MNKWIFYNVKRTNYGQYVYYHQENVLFQVCLVWRRSLAGPDGPSLVVRVSAFVTKLSGGQTRKGKVSEQDVVCFTHLLPVIKHGEEEHGHQQQRGLLGAQEVPAGAEKDLKMSRSSVDPPAASDWTQAFPRKS